MKPHTQLVANRKGRKDLRIATKLEACGSLSKQTQLVMTPARLGLTPALGFTSQARICLEIVPISYNDLHDLRICEPSHRKLLGFFC